MTIPFSFLKDSNEVVGWSNTKAISMPANHDRFFKEAITPLNDWTMCFWYKADSLPTVADTRIAGTGEGIFGGGSNFQFHIGMKKNTGNLGWYLGDQVNTIEGGSTQIVVGEWNHILITLRNSGNEMLIYLNGQVEFHYIFPGLNFAMTHIIIGNYKNSTQAPLGRIGQLDVYNDIMSDSEILDTYNGGVALDPTLHPTKSANAYASFMLGEINGNPNIAYDWIRDLSLLSIQTANSAGGDLGTTVSDVIAGGQLPFTNDKAMTFGSGVNNGYVHNKNIHPTPVTTFTTSCWYKSIGTAPLATPPNVHDFMATGEDSSNVLVRANATTGYVRMMTGNAAAGIGLDSTTNIIDGTWKLITVTCDGVDTKLYVNDNLIITASGSNSADDVIGGAYNNFSQDQGSYYISQLDSWTVDFSLTDVQNLYNAGVPINPRDVQFSNLGLISSIQMGDNANDVDGSVYDIIQDEQLQFVETDGGANKANEIYTIV